MSALAAPASGATSLRESPVTPLYAGLGAHESTPLSNPRGIFFDRVRQECYVADTGNGQVVIFNASGMPTYRFPHMVPGRNDEPIPGEPRSIVVDAKGIIYLVDGLAPWIDMLDPRGRSIARVSVEDDGCGQPERFAFVAMGGDGHVRAITACARPRVVTLDETGAATSTVVLQSPSGERACVTGFTLDNDANIYLTNTCATLMVQTYAPTGELVRAFGKHDTGFENFAVPAGLAISGDGSLWVVDTIRQVVGRFDPEGNLLAMVGGKGSQPGAFEYPSAVTTDGESLLFVLERQGSRYQCFRIHADAGAATTN